MPPYEHSSHTHPTTFNYCTLITRNNLSISILMNEFYLLTRITRSNTFDHII
ncbi:hypothetical protein HanXRQr2_Chr04g0184141 [Helianthus annuus]|uniref:Uncharacterized protein n=1 Tax=Helianthus annuus TaxID=4232 RepID=A0A251T6E1_HELAN|nr:hypothetical protein HanXRQr2_Chr04g0184141 [Helianthus annuus]